MKLVLEVPPTSYDCCIPYYVGIECDSPEQLYVALDEAMKAFVAAKTHAERERIRVLGREIDLSAFLDVDRESLSFSDPHHHVLTLEEFFDRVREDPLAEPCPDS